MGTFIYAIRNHYWYQFYLDDLPIWGMVGEVSGDDDGGEARDADPDADGEPLMYTHRRLSIGYNGDRIIQVNLTSENPTNLSPGAEITFTYTVEWQPVDVRARAWAGGGGAGRKGG